MPTPTTVIAVLAIPINKQGQFLLTQRYQPDNPDVHEHWQSAGGGLEFGEHPLQTVVREAQEELNVSFTVLHNQPIINTYTWAKGQPDDLHLLLMGYLGYINNQTPDARGDNETMQWGWFSLAEALELRTLPKMKEFLIEAQRIIDEENLLAKIS